MFRLKKVDPIEDLNTVHVSKVQLSRSSNVNGTSNGWDVPFAHRFLEFGEIVVSFSTCIISIGFLCHFHGAISMPELLWVTMTLRACSRPTQQVWKSPFAFREMNATIKRETVLGASIRFLQWTGWRCWFFFNWVKYRCNHLLINAYSDCRKTVFFIVEVYKRQQSRCRRKSVTRTVFSTDCPRQNCCEFVYVSLLYRININNTKEYIWNLSYSKIRRAMRIVTVFADRRPNLRRFHFKAVAGIVGEKRFNGETRKEMRWKNLKYEKK